MNRFTPLLLMPFLLVGCATTTPVDIAGSGTQLLARQIQTRQYDTLDKPMTMRSVVATLQDLAFTIDQADAELGTITATRYHQYNNRDNHHEQTTKTITNKSFKQYFSHK